MTLPRRLPGDVGMDVGLSGKTSMRDFKMAILGQKSEMWERTWHGGDVFIQGEGAWGACCVTSLERPAGWIWDLRGGPGI